MGQVYAKMLITVVIPPYFYKKIVNLFTCATLHQYFFEIEISQPCNAAI